jgi:aspartate beta-hydroxylase
MGLIMPRLADGRPAALLTIDGQEYCVAEGEWLLWDDTFIHEVRNTGDTVRCVLLLDVRRGHMPFDMRLLSRTVIAAVGAGVKLRGVG